MPHSPPRHNQNKVDANRLARQKDYNHNRRKNQAFYNSGNWRNLRNWFIKANPLCVECKAAGWVKAGDVVDHVIPIADGGEELSSDNLQTLCNMHHNQKTARENGRALITVVIGPPCAGKSTYARTQAKKMGGVLVDFDSIALALGAAGEHEASDEIRSIAIKARYAAIKEILDYGTITPAWIIESAPSATMIEYYKRRGVHFHKINTSEKICLERARDERPAKTIDRIKDWFKNPPQV